MGYTFRREAKSIPAVTTNYLRPRYTPSGLVPNERPMKAVITTSGDNQGHLSWGIVDDKDRFVLKNQKLILNPWTGVRLPQTIDEMKTVTPRNSGGRARLYR